MVSVWRASLRYKSINGVRNVYVSRQLKIRLPKLPVDDISAVEFRSEEIGAPVKGLAEEVKLEHRETASQVPYEIGVVDDHATGLGTKSEFGPIESHQFPVFETRDSARDTFRVSASVNDNVSAQDVNDTIYDTAYNTSFEEYTRGYFDIDTQNDFKKSRPKKDAVKSSNSLLSSLTDIWPYKNFPQNLPTPYQVLNELKSLRVGTHDGPERLSVSSLSKGWCELRKLYDIYLKLLREETPQMRQGTRIHERLESISHPQIDTSSLITAFENEVGVDSEELEGVDVVELVLSHPSIPIADQVTRLISLFSTGHAREVRVFAFVDPQDYEIVDITTSDKLYLNDTELVMQSGIIDHLTLNPLDDPIDWALHEELAYYERDLQDFFKYAPVILSQHRKKVEIVVSDIKTRGWRSVPSQSNVLRANEFQTFCYRKFLGIMGGQRYDDAKRPLDLDSVSFCYDLLIKNYLQRGVDIDSPIEKEVILPLLFKHQWLIADALRLKRGQSFESLIFNEQDGKFPGYDLSALKGIIDKNQDFAEVFDKELFTGEWLRPLTIKFILFRLAQFYDVMEPYLSDHCSIEYIVRQSESLEPFRTTNHHFNNEKVKLGLHHSALFYFSKEPNKIDLISPKTFSIYCEPAGNSKTGGCKYRDKCGWYQQNRRVVD